MAVFKMMNIKATNKNTNTGSFRLKDSIKYILNPEKTADGLYVGSHNCSTDANRSYNQMLNTKKYFGKEWGRQGYHFILSLKEGEGTPELLMQLTQEFVEEYLNNYETVYAIHNNTENLHAHIVFNSIDCIEGLKYHNENDEWEKVIMPIVNKLCEKYNLSKLELDVEANKKKKEESISWREQIRRDIDKCILKSKSYEEFLSELRKKGYTVSFGKYLYIKPKGAKNKFKSKTCGELYTVENIKKRILKLNSKMEIYKIVKSPQIQKYVFRKTYIKFQKFKLTEYQKMMFRQMMEYRKAIGVSKSNNYVSATDRRKFNKSKSDYMYLVENNISSYNDVESFIHNLENKNYEINKKIHNLKNEYEMYNPIIEKYEEMKNLKEHHDMFMETNDKIYLHAFLKYNDLEKELHSRGKSIDEIEAYISSYEQKIAELRQQRSENNRNIKRVHSIYKRVTDEKLFIKNLEKHKDINENYMYQDGTNDSYQIFSNWSENRKPGSMELDNWLDRRTSNLVSEGEYILCNRLNPDIHVKIKVDVSEYEGELYNRREYYLYRGDEQLTPADGKEYYTDERFDGRPKYYWHNLKKEMMSRLGETDDYIMFKNEDNYNQYMDSFRRFKEKEKSKETIERQEKEDQIMHVENNIKK